MADIEINFPDDFLSKLLDSEFNAVAEPALNECAPILVQSMKQAAKRVIQHDGASEMVNSISASSAKRTRTDAWIVNVNPKGSSSTKVYHHTRTRRGNYQVSNALKMIWLEYGVSGRQPARPFIASACNSVRAQIMAKIQEVYNQKVGAE